MKHKKFTVAGVEITAPEPESMKDMLDLCKTNDDVLRLASRGLDQVRRSYLLVHARKGVSGEELQKLSDQWFYSSNKKERT